MTTLVHGTAYRQLRSEVDVDLARRWMRSYRMLGLNPLPSRSDKKAPCCPYSDYWTTAVPHSVYASHRTSNVQVMTGARWRLAVIDLDGPVAIEAWRGMSMYNDNPDTWEVVNDPAKGRHLWYTLPEDVEAIASRFVWRLDGVDHANIELIGDRKLIMAPPSIHPATGRRYHFLAGHSPADMDRPALMPRWMIDLADVDAKPMAPSVPPAPRPCGGPRPAGSYGFDEVLNAIGDKVALAREWGVRVTGKRSTKGWAECHAIGREDRNPSAGIHEETGIYYDCRDKVRLGLFQLAVAIGAYSGVSEACNSLGDRFGASPRSLAP